LIQLFCLALGICSASIGCILIQGAWRTHWCFLASYVFIWLLFAVAICSALIAIKVTKLCVIHYHNLRIACISCYLHPLILASRLDPGVTTLYYLHAILNFTKGRLLIAAYLNMCNCCKCLLLSPFAVILFFRFTAVGAFVVAK